MSDANATEGDTIPPFNPAPAPDDSAAGANTAQPDLLGKIERASDRAIDQFAATAKRKPGQRGPDKSKRRPKVPVAPVGDGSVESLLAEGDTAPSPAGWQDDVPAVTDKTARVFAELGIAAFKEIRETIVTFAAHKITGDATLAEHSVKPVNEKLETAMTESGVDAIKELFATIQYSPWYTLIGGAVIIGAGDFVRLKLLKAKSAEVRGQQ